MMKAIQFKAMQSIDDLNVAEMIEIEKPTATGRDVLVSVEAVAMNPVDTKVRPKAGDDDRILGFDAAGTVVECGDLVDGLELGDKVYYSGNIQRSGSNAEFQLVDERLVAKRPGSISPAQAASVPLTGLTAWEALFDRLLIDRDGGNEGQTLLIIGGAGGMGSMGIQLAKLAGLTVVATASREKSSAWCRDLGADHVIDHRDSLLSQLQELGIDAVDFVANFNNTSAYWEAMGEVLAPQGKVVLIVEPEGELHLGRAYKTKSVTIVWEFMATRPIFNTPDVGRQAGILGQLAELIDAGKLKPSVGEVMGTINVENLVAAHRAIESGRTIGKLVLEGWD